MAEPVRTPSQLYADGVARGGWQYDVAQQPALAELDRLHAALLDPPKLGLFDRLQGKRPPAPQGLYLWGGVGRGKTFLIDLFYASLPFAEKQRTHFHRFMREIHDALRRHAGASDPLAIIAKEWRATLRVLVLDEFFVNDIGDAMLLGRLLDRLFAEGVALVTSSNTEPANLYKDGLQRDRFLPAIRLLEANTKVLYLDSVTDYRLRALTKSPVYRAPLDGASDAWLATRWQELCGQAQVAHGPLHVEGREIPVRACLDGHVWFDFAAICEGPRAASDYIEIATEHHSIFVGGIPKLDDTRADAARRFVHLIDELYDRHVNLVCTADGAPTELYRGDKLSGAFERTASRLIEMQSAEYLALEHRG
ncbi:cell division protein ZapE [Lysobacter sp. HA35]